MFTIHVAGLPDINTMSMQMMISEYQNMFSPALHKRHGSKCADVQQQIMISHTSETRDKLCALR